MIRVLLGVAAASMGINFSVAGADVPLDERLCIAPVKNGQATADDHHAAFRITGDVVVIPGVARPIIYGFNRGGVWTVDENDTLVPFGGEFPISVARDEFAHDPVSGATIGFSVPVYIKDKGSRLYRINSGEKHFTRIVPLNSEALESPRGITWIPRFETFIVADRTGLYRIDRSGTEIAPFLANAELVEDPVRIIDLPQLGALLVATARGGATLRYDDGSIARISSLGRGEAITSAVVSSDRSTLHVYSHNRAANIPVRRAGGTSFAEALDDALPEIYDTRVNVRGRRPPSEGEPNLSEAAIGKTVYRSWVDPLEVRANGESLAVPIPYQDSAKRYPTVVGYPAGTAVLILNEEAVYALDRSGTLTEVPGGRSVKHRVGIIAPFDDRVLITGSNALFLAFEQRGRSGLACPSPVPSRR